MEEKRWSLASINLHTMLRDVWKNLWMIVLVAASAVMLTRVASETIYKPEYTSSVTMSVTSKSGSKSRLQPQLPGPWHTSRETSKITGPDRPNWVN